MRVANSLAAHWLRNGKAALSRSFRFHRPRGAFCHRGWCQQCKTRLPDGTVVWEERGKARDLLAELRRYDPLLSLTRNVPAERWEVWRRDENGGQYRVFHCDGDLLPEVDTVVKFVRDHDFSRGYDPYVEAVVAAETLRAAQDAHAMAIAEASADRMHYELVDEMKGDLPAARPFYLNSGGRK